MKCFQCVGVVVLALLVLTQAHARSLVVHAPPDVVTKHHGATWRHNLKHQVAKLGLTADVTATIEESLFVKICNTVVPLINTYVQGLSIPGQSESHFSYSNIVIQEFHIDSISITFAAPSAIQMSLSQISFAIPQTSFEVKAKVLFAHLHCSGHFWASMSGTTIAISMDTTQSGGDLVFSNAQSSVGWGSLNIGHKFDHTVCKIGDKILEGLIGNINNLIKKTVENDIPSKIGPMVQTALDTAMTKLPLDFVSQPQVTSQSISLTVDLLGHVGASAAPLRSARVRALDPRDLELQVPATAANNLLIVAQQYNLLHMNSSKPSFNTTAIKTIFPAVYAQCPGCPFEIEVMTTVAPTVTMASDTISMSVTQLVLGLNIAGSGGSVIPFVDLWVNGGLAVSDVSIRGANALYFQLGIQSFNLAIKQSSIGPFDISLISSVADFALNDVVIPDFNNRFSGFALPKVAADAEVAVSDSSVFVAFNINL